MPFHRFGHMREAPLVKVGDTVKRGQLLGHVGNTGNSTSPHCHYDGTYEKPASWTQYILGMSKADVIKLYFDPNKYIDRVQNLPCPYDRFTGYSYLQPITEKDAAGNTVIKGYHSGVDINSGKDGDDDLGAEIRSTVSGKVVHIDNGHGWGNFLWIEESPINVAYTSMPSIPAIKPSVVDPGTLYVDDVEPLHTGPLPARFMYEDVPRVEQGMFTVVCTSVALTSIAAWQHKHHTGLDGMRFSIPANYVGGNEFWNDHGDLQPGLQPIAALVDAEQNGLLPNSVMPFAADPWVQPSGWYAFWYNAWQNLHSGLERFKFDKFSVRFENYQAMKEAIYRRGPLLVTIDLYRGWETGVANLTKKAPVHALIVTGWDDATGLYTVVDSSTTHTGDNGLRFLHPSNVFEAWAIAPKGIVKVEEVKAQQAQAIANNANRYGKQRNFSAEIAAAQELTTAFKKFNNKPVFDAAGKFWEILIRARAYGGYNVSYTKWGVWQPGDLINWVYAWRRDPKKVPFDLDKPRI